MPRRAKSQSISSQPTAVEPLSDTTMAPPPARALPRTSMTRQKTPLVDPAIAGDSLPAPKSAHAPVRPSLSKYLLALIISLVAEAASQQAVAFITLGDLGAISKKVYNEYESAAFIAWKCTLIAVMWFSGFDAIDVASLLTLLRTPVFILQYYFYTISLVTLIPTNLATIASFTLPFYLLRKPSAPHSSEPSLRRRLHNRIIIHDKTTTVCTAALAAAVFSTVLQISFSTFLPRFLVVHFYGLRDLTFAYTIGQTLPTLVLLLAPAGYASTQFLFKPSEGAATKVEIPGLVSEASGANAVPLHTYPSGHFDPATAGFAEHVYHNVWGWYNSRQRELIGRTATLGLLLVADNTINMFTTMRGVEWIGGAIYAGVWYVGVVLLGLCLEYVGAASD